jgi:DNA-binding NtrC family response regulator
VKGAFTGAVGARAGRFAAAHGGTLFLDEIGDLPLAAQAKLLRVLEERVVQPVGSDVETPVDVRIVAATHRDLEDMVAQGKFRADLYFRLAVVPIQLPALRDRGDDIDRIADVVVARAAERTGRRVDGFDLSARQTLRAHAWPGNIRELVHLVERAVLLAKQPRLRAADLKLSDRRASHAVGTVTPAITESIRTSLDLRTALDDLERDLIQRALAKASGNRTEAAALLGLNRTTLVEKLRKHAA